MCWNRATTRLGGYGEIDIVFLYWIKESSINGQWVKLRGLRTKFLNFLRLITKKNRIFSSSLVIGAPTGTRTRVLALKGLRPDL